MPLYDFICGGGHIFERYVSLAAFEETQFCHCGREARRKVCAPFVRGDLPGYASPITGEWISGRVQRKEDLRKHGCVEWEPGFAERSAAAHRQREEKLESSMLETFDREVANLPSRKRDALAGEIEGGLDVSIERRTSNG